MSNQNPGARLWWALADVEAGLLVVHKMADHGPGSGVLQGQVAQGKRKALRRAQGDGLFILHPERVLVRTQVSTVDVNQFLPHGRVIHAVIGRHAFKGKLTGDAEVVRPGLAPCAVALIVPAARRSGGKRGPGFLGPGG